MERNKLLVDEHGPRSVGRILSDYKKLALVSALQTAALLHQPTSSTMQRIIMPVRTVGNHTVFRSTWQRTYDEPTVCFIKWRPGSLLCHNGGSFANFLNHVPLMQIHQMLPNGLVTKCVQNLKWLAYYMPVASWKTTFLMNEFLDLEQLATYTNTESHAHPSSGTYTPKLFIFDADVIRNPILIGTWC